MQRRPNARGFPKRGTRVNKVKWGVLGVANIAIGKVIPAMQQGAASEVIAIASREREKAEAAARKLDIPRAYGSYEALLADPDVEAVYNPLPNHMHVSWTGRAAEAGKHVLCEKPIAMNAEEATRLLAMRDRTGVHIQEAFMVRTHPQWVAAREIVTSGRIGNVRSMSGFFSYFNADPLNIRNIVASGGGALMDIGCYLIHTARLIFGREPARVLGAIERDDQFGTDTLTSLVLDFRPGHVIGTCSTRLAPYQRVQVFGDRGRIEIEIPFNAPPDRPCRIWIDDGSDLLGGGTERIDLETCNQYTIQGDLFSEAIRGLRPIAYPLEDSVSNTRAIDAVFRSADSASWQAV
jgi:predicted dehydrogenase